MKFRVSPATFMVVFCCTYAFYFVKNWPLFLYYPLRGSFNWGSQITKGIGPAMAWYGLMVNAGIVAFAAAICVPSRALDALRNYFWIFPIGAMLVAVVLLRRLFI